MVHVPGRHSDISGGEFARGARGAHAAEDSATHKPRTKLQHRHVLVLSRRAVELNVQVLRHAPPTVLQDLVGVL